jgi:hypothetical protein
MELQYHRKMACNNLIRPNAQTKAEPGFSCPLRLAVPELTRSASIQLNKRVSLQGHAKAIA